jgi:type II secretory pathway pseudopilin PulG
MIEVLLALTVIAVGMTSVLGLFPVGLNASREAIAQNCSADVADQMVTYMRVMGESSANAYAYTFTDANNDLPIYDSVSNPDTDNTDDSTLDIYTNAAGDTTINIEGTPNVNVQTLSDSFLTAYRTDKVGVSNVSNVNGYIFRRVAPGWAVFTVMPNPSTLRRRVYFIVQGPDCTEDAAANHNIDFSAMALVWKEPVQIKRMNSTGTWEVWPANPSDSGDPKTLPLDPTLSASYDYSSRINVELSWPLELPYKDRKKRYYQIVINKPDA